MVEKIEFINNNLENSTILTENNIRFLVLKINELIEEVNRLKEQK